MGMDVYGKKPSAEEGRYFRNSIWGWYPLAEYLTKQLPPALTAGCTHWHTNDGDGLNAVDSRHLAAAIEAEVGSGRAEQYVKQRDARIAALPIEVCFVCEGRGIRTPADDERLGVSGVVTKAEGVRCNACRGVGGVPPREASYHLTVENLAAFAHFLHFCGGFEIW